MRERGRRRKTKGSVRASARSSVKQQAGEAKRAWQEEAAEWIPAPQRHAQATLDSLQTSSRYSWAREQRRAQSREEASKQTQAEGEEKAMATRCRTRTGRR